MMGNFGTDVVELPAGPLEIAWGMTWRFLPNSEVEVRCESAAESPKEQSMELQGAELNYV
jgi:hypothetical protein